jgi:endoglucanase
MTSIHDRRGRPATLAILAMVVVVGCSSNPQQAGPSQALAEPTAAASSGPVIDLKRGGPPAQGSAPSIKVAGNQLVDDHGSPLQLAGVNVAGVEGVCVQEGFQQGSTADRPGPVFDFGGPVADPPTGQVQLPPQSYVDAIASWHVTAVRIMINEMCWLGRGRPGANPATAPIPDAHYYAAAYQQAIIDFTNALHAQGIAVLLTLGDNPCPSDNATPPGSEYSPCDDNDQVMPDADNSVDFWTSAATVFSDDHAVLFDLFNEPHINRHEPLVDDRWGCWLNGCNVPGEGWRTAGMQQLIDAIRATGATNVVVVEGLSYASDLGEQATPDLPANGWLDPATRPVDRISPPQLAASNHIYTGTFDATDRGCPNGSDAACWSYHLSPIAAMVPLMTGEFGEWDCDTSSAAMDAYERWADSAETLPDGSSRAPVSYLAWTFNADYGCYQGNSTLLLSYDWNSTPNVAGEAFRQHLISLNP